MHWSFLILTLNFIGCAGNLTCITTEGMNNFEGYHLRNQNFKLQCESPVNSGWVNVTCRIGTSTSTDTIHVVTLEKLKNNNSISCEYESKNTTEYWTRTIDTDPKIEMTLTVGDERVFIDVYFGINKVFIIYNSGIRILRVTNILGNSFKIEKTDSIISWLEKLSNNWVRIHLTPITLKHAGRWETLSFFNPASQSSNLLTSINVQSNFTCADNSSLCRVENYSPIVELQCSASRISLFQWNENIVCRIDNETLNSTSSSESKFLVDSSQHEGKRVVCFSRNTNQTWESSQIKHFHRETINTTKAISVENSNKRDCKYSWIAPDFRAEIFENVLNESRMELHGYGKYLGIISCQECVYINYVVNFIDSTSPTTPKLTTPPTTRAFSTSIVSESLYVQTTLIENRRDFYIQGWFINAIVSIVLIFLVCGIFWRLRKPRYVPIQRAV